MAKFKKDDIVDVIHWDERGATVIATYDGNAWVALAGGGHIVVDEELLADPSNSSLV